MASVFSGRAGRLAGIWAADQAQNNYNQQQGTLAEGRDNSLSAIDSGRTSSLAALGQGYGAAVPEYQAAIERFNPWTEAGKSALTTYQNSLGQNGAEGNAAAVAQFQASPGYQYQLDQATDAVARKASALGALGSGNTMQAITDRASNLANQEYGGWQDRLNGLSNTGLQASGQQANIQQGLGNLYAQQGRDQSNVYSDAAGKEAGIHTGYANANAGALGNLGQTIIGAGTGALMAGQTAAQNRLNFGMNLGKTAVSLLAAPMTGGLSLMGLGGGLGGNLGTTPGAGGLY
ncbi:hypothetical protein [Bosea vaviloviae]|uniref:DNA transfer protein n=1 Tax=Bosea vaviloviae TaxID=1526658 RepID=A0A1D7U2R0_9HYPH|nr:hypothetical protein [Bosea vaviloviae]AOO81661.1 hypothetical protein BHK69_15440 [Bosea vaviloviae]